MDRTEASGRIEIPPKPPRAAFIRLALRYALVGLGVAAFYLATFEILRAATALPNAWASAIAFVLAILLQYAAHGRFTFRRELHDPWQFARFIVTVGGGFVLSTWFVGYGAPALGLGPRAAALVVVVTLPVYNFIIFAAWVFAMRHRPG